MSLTPSTMKLKPGDTAPLFTLHEPATGHSVSLLDFKDAKAILVCFVCNHCPYVVHVKDEIARIERDYREQGLTVLAINSNDVEQYPEDSPEKMILFARESRWDFPYLFDPTQEVAKKYSAACTPDLFLFDGDRKLTYRGQLDDSRPGNGKPITGKDLRNAIELMLEGKEVDASLQKPSSGCNIKWKS